MMIVNSEQVRKIVAAARTAMLLDDILRQAFSSKTESKTEKIAGDLLDVLSEIAGEKMSPGQDFTSDSKIVALVKNTKVSEEQVSLIIEKLSEKNTPANIPPKFYSREDIEKFLDENGGYSAATGYIVPDRKGKTPHYDWGEF